MMLSVVHLQLGVILYSSTVCNAFHFDWTSVLSGDANFSRLDPLWTGLDCAASGAEYIPEFHAWHKALYRGAISNCTIRCCCNIACSAFDFEVTPPLGSVLLNVAADMLSVNFTGNGSSFEHVFSINGVPISNGTVEIVDASGWQPIRATSAPQPVRGHSAVSARFPTRLVVFGGRLNFMRPSGLPNVSNATVCRNDCYWNSSVSGTRGRCVSGVCSCLDGYSGIDCGIDEIDLFSN
eukprot:241143_1